MERMGHGRGYCDDYTMSVNASEAYERGEAPLSKWTKGKILQGIRPAVIKCFDLERVPLGVLKIYALEETCEHHTSKIYNATTFYRVRPEIAYGDGLPWFLDEEQLRIGDAVADAMAMRSVLTAKARRETRKARVAWDEWDQRRKRFVRFESWAVLSGPWAYCERGKRKKVDGSHFEVLATYTRAPRGAGDVFRRLMALVPSGK